MVNTSPSRTTYDVAAPLTSPSAKTALRKLPYRYSFRTVRAPKGASEAIVGEVSGPKETRFHFSVSFGKNALAVPLPGVGTGNPVADHLAGYTFNTDLEYKIKPGLYHYGRTIHNKAQWEESGHMATSMEEALCHQAIHEPCPV